MNERIKKGRIFPSCQGVPKTLLMYITIRDDVKHEMDGLVRLLKSFIIS